MALQKITVATQTFILLLCPLACQVMGSLQSGHSAGPTATWGCECCHPKQAPASPHGSTPDRSGKCCVCAGALVESANRQLDMSPGCGLACDVPQCNCGIISSQDVHRALQDSLHIAAPPGSGRALRLLISSLTI